MAKIAQAVFLASIDPSLVSDIQFSDKVHVMYNSLKKQFKTVSRAAQMNLWFQLLNFNLNPNTPTFGIATHLKDIYAKMKSVNVRMCSDTVLGFILQSSIMTSQAGFRNDFEQCLKHMIQRDPDMRCPTFSSLL